MIHFYRRGVLLLIIGLTACRLPGVAVDPAVPATPQPETTTELDQVAMQATIDAGVNATAAAGQPDIDPQATINAAIQATTAAQAREEASSPTVVREEEPDPTAAPTTAAPASAETSATQESGPTTPPADQPVVFAPDEGDATQQTINIQLVFDASGSMAEDIGGETKIAAARRALERVIDQLETDNPNLNVGFRVFGHEGDNTEAGKAVSCQSTELLVPVSGVDTDLLRQQTAAWDPTGWTPISLALQRAAEDLTAGENVRNVIIMVTDGEETCDGDPCAIAQALTESGAEVRIDVVGFGLTPEVADTLQCISENTGGVYIDAQDGDALAETLEILIEAAITRSYLRINAIGPGGRLGEAGVDLGTIVDQQGELRDSRGEQIGSSLRYRNPDGSGDSTAPLSDGATIIELRPETYTFEIRYTLGVLRVRNEEAGERIFTAVVEEGKETVATVGTGSFTLTSEGVPDDYIKELALYGEWNGEWSHIEGCASRPVCATISVTLEFDKEILIAPGNYRVLDFANNADGDVVAEFTIDIGKEVTVQVTGAGETGE